MQIAPPQYARQSSVPPLCHAYCPAVIHHPAYNEKRKSKSEIAGAFSFFKLSEFKKKL